MKKILLNPQSSNELKKCYSKAANKSTDLLIATAFLTEWPFVDKLSQECKNILILVGTDFGLTRKRALHNLLKWIPSQMASNLLAVPSTTQGSFHPKIIAWKEKNDKYFSIIGSSNLTNAAFDKNFEVNICQEISKTEFNKIKKWLREIALDSQVITSDWISSYKESNKNNLKQRNRKSKYSGQVIDLEIKLLKKHKKKIIERRNQQQAFEEIKKDLLILLQKSANQEISNSTFWESFWNLWSGHKSRFQGSGIQFSGKKANWTEACQALLSVINGPVDIFDLDNIVQKEIDSLKQARNPVRGAWFSEMLCHFYPNSYPVINNPVKTWLRIKKWRPQRGSTEGSKYIELSRKLRITIKRNPEIKNLAELDHVIWKIIDDLNE